MNELKIYTNSNSDYYIEKLANAVKYDAPEFLIGMLECRCPEESTMLTKCAVLTGLAEYMDIPIKFEYISNTDDLSSDVDTIKDLIYILVNTSNNPDANKYGDIIKLLINKLYENQ